MAFEELRPLTLSEINSAIWEMTCEFGVPSAEFQAKGAHALGIPEDSAMEWSFLLLQRAALEATQPRYQGMHSHIHPETVDEQDALIQLAA
jgi:hypothetical protein